MKPATALEFMNEIVRMTRMTQDKISAELLVRIAKLIYDEEEPEQKKCCKDGFLKNLDEFEKAKKTLDDFEKMKAAQGGTDNAQQIKVAPPKLYEITWITT